MELRKRFDELDSEELLLLLIILPAERSVHLLLKLGQIEDTARLASLLRRLVEWEGGESEPLKELFSLPMGINLLDYMFGSEYAPDEASSGDMYWGYVVNGCRKAADIIAHLGVRDSQRIVDHIRRTDHTLWERLRGQVFLWEDIVRLSEQELSVVLRQLSGLLTLDEGLGAFIAMQTPAIAGKLLSSLPMGRRNKVWNILRARDGGPYAEAILNDMEQGKIRLLAYRQICAGNIRNPNSGGFEN